MNAYYNEYDTKKVAWLRELIRVNLIAPGDVDERSITEVRPSDIARYTQCHFFAGIGVWSYALRNAGWDDTRPVWTGSCPCQSFSTAGKQLGYDDPRHLWPAWFRLIRKCRPQHVFGEQVSGAIRHGWLDLVSSDLEGEGYAVGSAVFGAHSVGAPHIRQRLYFVAQSESERRGEARGEYRGRPSERTGDSREPSGVAESQGDGASNNGGSRESHPQRNGAVGELADTEQRRWQGGGHGPRTSSTNVLTDLVELGDPALREGGAHNGESRASARRTEPTGGSGIPRAFWSDCDWLPCRDGKARPVESRLEPMADGTAAELGYVRDGDTYTLAPLMQGSRNRTLRLRGYGDGIVAPQAQVFIEAYMTIQEAKP